MIKRTANYLLNESIIPPCTNSNIAECIKSGSIDRHSPLKTKKRSQTPQISLINQNIRRYESDH
jgi:hypothetical protein